eukprot:1829549-Pyramimonas_sp.AAC.1
MAPPRRAETAVSALGAMAQPSTQLQVETLEDSQTMPASRSEVGWANRQGQEWHLGVQNCM